MVYLITYNKPLLKNTKPLEEEIKKVGKSWAHYLNNTWLVYTPDLSANKIYNKLVPHLDTGMRILIVKIDRDYQGYLDKGVWKWLKKQFDKDDNINYFLPPLGDIIS